MRRRFLVALSAGVLGLVTGCSGTPASAGSDAISVESFDPTVLDLTFWADDGFMYPESEEVLCAEVTLPEEFSYAASANGRRPVVAVFTSGSYRGEARITHDHGGKYLAHVACESTADNPGAIVSLHDQVYTPDAVLQVISVDASEVVRPAWVDGKGGERS